MKLLTLAAFQLSLLMSCNTPREGNEATSDGMMLSYKIFEAGSSGFGYEIFQNKKRIISQPYPPGRTGNAGFQTTDEARSVAEFVMAKIRKGEMPPTVKKNELDSLLLSIKK